MGSLLKSPVYGIFLCVSAAAGIWMQNSLEAKAIARWVPLERSQNLTQQKSLPKKGRLSISNNIQRVLKPTAVVW